jgi:NTP pyrophosphatase (non-canonical NTP hydrolase)
MALESLQRAVDAALAERAWPPLANLARLCEEVGELARELNCRFGPKPRKPGEREGDLAEELGDVLFVLLALANAAGVDLAAAGRRALDKQRRRAGPEGGAAEEPRRPPQAATP